MVEWFALYSGVGAVAGLPLGLLVQSPRRPIIGLALGTAVAVSPLLTSSDKPEEKGKEATAVGAVTAPTATEQYLLWFIRNASGSYLWNNTYFGLLWFSSFPLVFGSGAALASYGTKRLVVMQMKAWRR